jgi:hypothetical protein
MKTRLLPFLAGVLTVVLLLELAFRVLPVATATQGGYYEHPLILSYPARHCFIASTGWDLKGPQRICANNAGFVADHDFVADPMAVGVVGDSYVEANMLPAEKRIGAALERQLEGRTVYTFGGPGSNLLDYAVRAKYAAEKFGIRTFVFVLERNDVKQVMCGSGHVHGACMDADSGQIKTATQAPPGLLKRVIRESALAQYLVSQLKIDLSKPLWKRGTKASATTGNGPELSTSQKKATVDYFFQQILTIEDGRFVFVVDPDRAHLLDHVGSDRGKLLDMMRDAGNQHAVVIDPSEEFRKYLVDTHKILAVGPYDPHWNGDAVEIVAKLAGNALAGKDR